MRMYFYAVMVIINAIIINSAGRLLQAEYQVPTEEKKRKIEEHVMTVLNGAAD